MENHPHLLAGAQTNYLTNELSDASTLESCLTDDQTVDLINELRAEISGIFSPD
ncbi:MAG TPA: hypothetical protein PLL94_14485 [Bacteroidales bacterium]|jgi:hypothetical protein|nr:MAG: hypothetical protein BWY95_02480 [Bacteroidetes bacterium ADurb.BinA104]HQK69344.1 hypothetical protein [Bacteroidales bacterium]